MKTADYLLSLPLPEAGDWIDSNLPEPPNPAALTGFNPLPNLAPTPIVTTNEAVPPPAPAQPEPIPSPPTAPRQLSPIQPVKERSPPPSIPSPSDSSAKPTRSRATSVDGTETVLTSVESTSPPRKRPQLPEQSERNGRPQHAPRSPRSRPRTLPDQEHRARVQVSRFPVGFNGYDLEAVFSDVGVICEVILCHSRYQPTYAFVDVDQEDLNRCLDLLNFRVIYEHEIRCDPAKRRPQFSPGNSIRPAVPRRPGSPPPPSRPRDFPPRLPPASTVPSPARSLFDNDPPKNLMILNLPYLETDEARIVLNKFRSFELVRLSDRDQAVAWFPQTSRGDHLFKLWDDFAVDGKRLKVVTAKDGLTREEAIEDYFKNSRRERERSRSRSVRSRSKRSISPGRDDRERSSKYSSSRSSKRRHRSPSVESNDSYGPSPPPPTTTDHDDRPRHTPSSSRTKSGSSSRLRFPSSSRTKRHHSSSHHSSSRRR